jgi:Na+/proline symporter
VIGLLGTSFYPDLKDSETLMPILAKAHLNYFFYIIFIGALVSAILSTVDTTLLASSALLSHNLIYPTFPQIKENKKVFFARLCTLISGILAYVIAYSSDSIIDLVETASSLGGPTILVITIAALWDKRGTAFNALFAMIMSLVAWLLGHFIIEIEYPVIFTVGVCVLTYFGSMPFARSAIIDEQKAEPEIKLGQ